MRIRYLIRQSVRGLSQRLGFSFLLLVCLASSFLVVSTFLLITRNLRNAAEKLGGQVQIAIFLSDDITPEQTSSLFRDLRNLPEVEAVNYRSKEDALSRLRNYLGRDCLEELESNPLPTSFELGLKKEFRGFETIARMASKIRKKEGVEEVEFGAEWLKRLDQAVQRFSVVDSVFGIFLILAVGLIVSSFMRVTVSSQLRSVQVLKLLGASRRDIVLPFFMHGSFLGLGGALLGVLLSWAGCLTFSMTVTPVVFLPFPVILGLIVGGVILGGGGSFIAAIRCLQPAR
ncbi:MAG: permease-like cell division protein FtsX [Candidatus Zixiibacteriota bacterium]